MPDLRDVDAAPSWPPRHGLVGGFAWAPAAPFRSAMRTWGKEQRLAVPG